MLEAMNHICLEEGGDICYAGGYEPYLFRGGWGYLLYWRL